jgi:hypothetical protein
MRVNKYDQIPQIMTGQLITPAAAVFPGLAAAAAVKRGSLQLSSGSFSVPGGSRGVASAAEGTTTTLFGFKPKPKSGANTRHTIQFLH